MNILYFSQINWNWIAQRPQYVALELDKHHDVTVLYPRFLVGEGELLSDTPRTRVCRAVPQIPFQERNALFREIGSGIFRRYTGDLSRYDVIWFCTPLFFRLVPPSYKGIVVFDYMDDLVRLQGSPAVARYMKQAQEKLVERADLIFTTSEYLKNTLPEIAASKTHLIRNGYTGGVFLPPEKPSGNGKGKSAYNIGYVGTISEWMDFRSLLKSLDEIPEITYHFYGPRHVDAPVHERLIFHGTVEHDLLPDAVKDMDALIMPFVLNEIVLAVDPVKLYEYISFGKPVISIRYPEVAQFQPFAEFYDNADELVALLRKKIADGFAPIYDEEEQRSFLADCTWEARVARMLRILEEKTAP